MKKPQFTILLLSVLLIVGVLPLGIIGSVSVKIFHDAEMQHAFHQLQSVRESRERQLEGYFAAREVEMDILIDIVSMFQQGSHDTQESEAWVQTHAQFFTKYRDRHQYADVYLIRADGYCFYSVAAEADYETNLMTGPYADTSLGKLVKTVSQTKTFGVADVEPYAPSNGEPSLFMAQPIVQSDEIVLIMAVQLFLDPINAIMQSRGGLGETGETYLVGPDKLMRSDSIMDPEHHSVPTSFANPTRGTVDTVAVRQALSGNTGEMIIRDYTGYRVLSAYAPLQLGDITWGVIAEIEEAEVAAGANNLKRLLVILSVVWLLPLLAMFFAVSRVVPVHGAGTIDSPSERESFTPSQGITEMGLKNSLKRHVRSIACGVYYLAGVGLSFIANPRDDLHERLLWPLEGLEGVMYLVYAPIHGIVFLGLLVMTVVFGVQKKTIPFLIFFTLVGLFFGLSTWGIWHSVP